MIDNQDKQTQPLDLGPAPKRRGRPAKEKALSNAERQRLYRERQKAQRDEKQESHPVPYEEVVGIAQELGERCKSLEERFRAEFKLGEKARHDAHELRMRVAQLEHQVELAKGAAKPKKHRDDEPLKRILGAFDQMCERRNSGEMSELDALWGFAGAALSVLEQHGLTAQELKGKRPAKP